MVTQARCPHFLLYSEAASANDSEPCWRFVLHSVESGDEFSAGDLEAESRASRLELLAVVRGLEALDQPSRVTLVTRSRYITRGIRRELAHWRERRWRWERFGQLVPIRDHDLWQRVDGALQYHKVTCVSWRFASEPHLAGIAKSILADKVAPLEPALLIVPRDSKPRASRRSQAGHLTQAFSALRESILAPFSAIVRPAFTRAA